MKTKIYLLGPVSPWNSIRKENFVTAAEKIRKLGLDVECCYDFLITDARPEKAKLFMVRLNAMLASQHVVLLQDWQTDEQATCLYNVANNADITIESFNKFIAHMETPATA